MQLEGHDVQHDVDEQENDEGEDGVESVGDLGWECDDVCGERELVGDDDEVNCGASVTCGRLLVGEVVGDEDEVN